MQEQTQLQIIDTEEKQRVKQLELLQLELTSSTIRLAWTVGAPSISKSNFELNTSEKLIRRRSTDEFVDNKTQISKNPGNSDSVEASAEVRDEPRGFEQSGSPAEDTTGLKSANLTALRGQTNLRGPTQRNRQIVTNISQRRQGKNVQPINDIRRVNSTTVEVPDANRTKADKKKSESSTWLIRLRRFGSNDVDSLKLVVNHQELEAKSIRSQMIRFISFKDLEPSTPYNLCLEAESSGSKHEIIDKFQLLDSRPLGCIAWNASDSAPKCKEFFTLPTGFEPNSVTLGQLTNENTNSSQELISHLRRPKSLTGLQVKSHTQLLEVDDPPSLDLGSSRNYEFAASRPIGAARSLSDGVTPWTNHSTSPTSRLITIGWTIPPAIGYIFAVIFLLALVNLLLNSTSSLTRYKSPSRVSKNKRRQQKQQLMQARSGILPSKSWADLSTQSSSESGSSLSFVGGSQSSRLMMVGGASQHFGYQTGFLEPENCLNRKAKIKRGNKKLDKAHIHRNFEVGSKNGTAKHVLSLVSDARFPMGSSFEGDSRHNADMVGLARKNYDHFISQVYNPTEYEVEHHDSPYFFALNAQCHGNEEFSKHRPNHHEHHKRSQQHLCSPRVSPQLSDRMQRVSSSSESESPTKLLGNSDDKPMRLRYDKINPLYKMSPQDQQRATRVSNPNLVTSFTSSPTDHRSRSFDSRNPELRIETCPKSVGYGSTCHGGDTLGAFDCCLDRQQQRFQQQQQQLERRLGLNGNLVTQPIISPLVSQQFDRDDEQELVSVSIPDEIRAVPSPAPPPPPPPEPPASSPYPNQLSQTKVPPKPAKELEEPKQSKEPEKPNGAKEAKDEDQKGVRETGEEQSSTKDIKQTEFQQRRSELQSKLQFVHQAARSRILE